VGHRKWEDKLIGSVKYESLKDMDPAAYAEEQKAINKDFESRKRKAPATFGGKEGAEYTKRVQEHDYVKSFPVGMQPYMKNLNARENACNKELNAKFKKDGDIKLEDYKKAAVEKMYYSLVRNKAEAFSKRDFFKKQNTAAIDNLMDPEHIDDCLYDMKRNTKLMTAIEEEYNRASKAGTVAKSLQNGDKLREMYTKAYTPEKGWFSKDPDVMKDPVFGEYHGSPEAVQKAQEKDPIKVIH
jgi:hypothetical protein